MNKFVVYYKDGSSFQGNPFQTDWKKVDPDKIVTKFEYYMPKFKITMEGYKQYNHLLECVGFGKTNINKIMLMGRKNEYTDIVIIDLKRNIVSQGERSYGKEYGNQILDGWVNGELNDPRIY